MNVILIADLSINGKVLQAENPAHPVPESSVGFYIERAIAAGNIILGSGALCIFQEHFGGVAQALPGVNIIILSSKPSPVPGVSIAASPEAAITLLEQQGASEVVIGGGTATYNAFLSANLVTEIFLHTIPVLTGDSEGLNLLPSITRPFQLASSSVIGEGITQSHYRK